MLNLKAYLMRLIVAGVICGIVEQFIGKSATSGRIIKAVCGLFMLVVFATPLVGVKWEEYVDYFGEIQSDAAAWTENGTDMYQTAVADVITNRVQTYILAEAGKLDLTVDVEVTLDDSNPPIPVAVVLSGRASPYQKQIINNLIQNDLGILQEHIQWK